MAGVTPNIRLNLPTYDQPGWDTLLAANWSVLDSLVARTLNLPGGYTGVYVPGATYTTNSIATDVTDSSLWQAGSGFTTLVGNTFAQERAANPTHWTNVTVSTSNAAVSAGLAAGSATAAATSATAAQASAVGSGLSAVTSITNANLAAASAASSQNTFKNKLINPQFNLQQMNALGVAASVANSSSYQNDGWSIQSVGTPAASATILAATDAHRTAMADEYPSYYMQCITAGVPGVNDFFCLQQRMENNYIFSGKTVVFSFWALASVGGSKICVEFAQNFGTGGSPSATVSGLAQQVFTLTTGLAYYTTGPIFIPSIIGKTLGSTVNTDYFQMRIFLTAGATFGASNAGNIGSQAFTLTLLSPQLEINSVASSFERRPIVVDLMQAQRFYEAGGSVGVSAPTGATGSAITFMPFKVSKRIVPTVGLSTNTFTNVTSSSVSGISAQSFVYQAFVTGAGAFSSTNNWVADARL